MSSSFRRKLENRVAAIDSLLCVGLDPHENELFPTDGVANNNNISDEDKANAAYTFCKTLIEQTLPYAACYKPNVAFFEKFGSYGVEALRRVVQECNDEDVPVLLDSKRGDIGSTASAYADAAYEYLNADAVTLSPLMGWDSVRPFVTGNVLLFF